MSEEYMQEQLTEDIFNLSKDLNLRYCDCVTLAKELIKKGWEKGEENSDE